MPASVLPESKFPAWRKKGERLIETGKSKVKELECLVGWMTHLSVIVPFVNHFLSRIRDLQNRAKNRRKIKIDIRCLDDLRCMIFS